MPSGLFYFNCLDLFIPDRRGVWQDLLLPRGIDIPVCYANSVDVDPDQMPRSVASALGLHCLPVSLLRGARHKWVKALVYVW